MKPMACIASTFAEDFKKMSMTFFEFGVLPEDPSFYLYRPTLKDASLAPEGHEGLYVLVPVPELSKFNDWQPNTITNYRNKIIHTLKEKRFSMISMSISFLETYHTPQDFKDHYYNAYNGATFGLKPTLSQSNYYRPHNKFAYAEGFVFLWQQHSPRSRCPNRDAKCKSLP